MMLVSMGFSDAHAKRALKETGGAVDRAADWLFSRDLSTLEEEAAPAAPAAGSAPDALKVCSDNTPLRPRFCRFSMCPSVCFDRLTKHQRSTLCSPW